MDLKDLRYFCLVAEIQHVTNAAERLGVSQPSLTRTIRLIEDEVGAELFDNVGRRIKLNCNGAVFYKYAKKVIAAMDRLHCEMDQFLQLKDQTITLLSNTQFAAQSLIVPLQEENANYKLSVLYSTHQEMIDALKSGEAQFAFCCPPIPDGNDNIITEGILGLRGCVLLPPGHKLLSKKVISLDDLRSEALITMPANSAMRNKLQTIFEEYDFFPQIAVETYNVNMIIKAVQSGAGYAFINDMIMDDYPELKPYCVDLDIAEIKGYLGLSYNKLYLENSNVNHFRKFMLKFLDALSDKYDKKDALN